MALRVLINIGSDLPLVVIPCAKASLFLKFETLVLYLVFELLVITFLLLFLQDLNFVSHFLKLPPLHLKLLHHSLIIFLFLNNLLFLFIQDCF